MASSDKTAKTWLFQCEAPTQMQTCQVSRNFRESPEIVHDLQVLRKCYKSSRNLGNLIDLLFFFVSPEDGAT